MPTLPLYQPNLIADASHAVRAPGGYEWWYFDAEEPATDTQIVAIYLHGFIFHPGYLRAHARFLRRPTKTPPPLPDDFVCMYLVVYRGGKILSQLMTQYPASAYAAATDQLDVRIGPNTLRQTDAGLALHVEGAPWELTWQGPKTHAQRTLAADLVFTPSLPPSPIERRFLSREMTQADHHWIIANPHCQVAGTLHIPTTDDAATPIQFEGRGYHDHNYGTAPLGPGLARWFWGRALGRDRVVTFHYAVPKNPALPPESHVVIADAAGPRDAGVTPQLRFDRHTPLGLAYPSEAVWLGVLTLSEPRVIDATPFYLRLQYTADAFGERTTAFCEVAYPHRLRWPVLGRMIEMSIQKRTRGSG